MLQLQYPRVSVSAARNGLGVIIHFTHSERRNPKLTCAHITHTHTLTRGGMRDDALIATLVHHFVL